jgi:hypothetical protein
MKGNPFAGLIPTSDKKAAIWNEYSPRFSILLEQLNEALFDSKCELKHDVEGLNYLTSPNVVLIKVVEKRGARAISHELCPDVSKEGAQLGICMDIEDGNIRIVLTTWTIHRTYNQFFQLNLVFNNDPVQKYRTMQVYETQKLLRNLKDYGKEMYNHLKSLGYV